MPKLLPALLTAAACSLPAALSAAGLDDATEFNAARQALADGLPGVAAVKAERLLKRKDWTKAETRKLATFAAEAWTRAQAAEAVLKLVEAHDLDDKPFWEAQAQALRGNLPAARTILTENEQSPRPPRAALLLAQVLAASGQPAAARSQVEPLTASSDAQISRQARLLLQEISLDEGAPVNIPAGKQDDEAAALYLRARSQLQADQIDSAKATLDEVLASSTGGERVRHASVLLQGEVLLRQKQPEAAQAHLLKVLDAAAECSLWPEAFDLLDRAHMAMPRPRLLPETVLRWMSSGNTAQQQPEPSPALLAAAEELRGHATYIVARWLAAEKRQTEAAGLLEALLQAWPYHPRVADAMRLAMEIYSSQRADDRVLSLADSWRGRFGDSSAPVKNAAASIFFRRGEHWQAQQAFQDAANLAPTLSERRRALFNAALTAVQAGNLALYLTLLGQLEVSGLASAAKDSTDSVASLELEKALFFASQRKPEAEESLRAFVRTYPAHPRFAEACVALAEWMLMATPPRVEHARTTLDMATTSSMTPEQRQRVDCTRLWLREASGDLKALVTEGAAFLKAWPKSDLVPEVRLRIAGAHYRLEDYASARTEFEIIALNYPDTPHAETSLYFAAMSASSVMSKEGRERALAIWGELAAKGGALAVAARRQQALSERAQGHLGEALAALDKLLAVKNLELEQRRVTLCEKAEVLLLMGKTEPARLTAAVTLLDDFLSDTTLPMLWKARAGFTLATVHHDAGRDTEALEACYNVLRAADISPPTSPADYVWFSKAGFFGIDLLEAGRQWEPAARLAEQMAQHPSNRAAEARERATKIRLEHFLWDGPAPVAPKELMLDDKSDPAVPTKSPSKGNAKG